MYYSGPGGCGTNGTCAHCKRRISGGNCCLNMCECCIPLHGCTRDVNFPCEQILVYLFGAHVQIVALVQIGLLGNVIVFRLPHSKYNEICTRCARTILLTKVASDAKQVHTKRILEGSPAAQCTREATETATVMVGRAGGPA